MANAIGAQIESSRLALAQAKAQIVAPRVTQAQLLRGGLKQRLGLKGQAEAVRAAKGRITSAEQSFEKQVAEQAPQHATEGALSKAFQEASKLIQSKISGLDVTRKAYQEKLTKELAKGDKRSEKREDSLRESLRSITAELGSYAKGLAGSKVDVVKKHFSGYTQQMASYAKRKVEASISRSKAKRRAKEQFKQQVKSFELAHPGEKLIIKEGKVIGVDSAKLQQSVLIEHYQAPTPSVSIASPTFGEMIGLPPLTDPVSVSLQKFKAPDYKMSIAPSLVVPTTPIAPPPMSIDPYKALGLPPPTDPLSLALQKPIATHKAEQQRYQDFGYTSSEASKLATESLKLGGVSFTPSRAADIIVGPLGTQAAREKLGAQISGRIKKLAVGTGELLGRAFEVSKPILEKEFRVPLVLGVTTPTGVTKAEVVAFPSVFVRRAAELSGVGWEDIYSKTIDQLPQEWKPSKILPGKEEEYLALLEDLRTGRIKRKDVSFEGLVIPLTPEEVGRVAEVGAELALFGAAAVVGGPVAVGTLLTSDVVSAQQDYIGAPEEAKKEAKKLFEEYLKTKLGRGERYLTETEFIKEISPNLEEGIKRQALIEGGTSLAFLSAGAGAKLLGAGAKVVGAEGKLIALQESKVIDRTIGFTKKNGDITQIVVKTKRKIKGAESETTTMFNVRKTGDKTFQVEKGTGVQQITLDRPFRKPLKIEEPFTFAGPVEEVVGRKVIQRQVSEQGLKSLKEELKGVDVTVGDLRMVFGKDDLTVVKKSFFGISPKIKKEIEITRKGLIKEVKVQPFIGGELEKVIKPKVDVVKVIEKPVGIGKPTEIGILIEAPKVPVKPKIITITGVPPKPPKELLAEKLIRQIDEGIKIPTPGIDKVIDIGRAKALMELEEKIIGKGIVGITAEAEALKVALAKIKPPKFILPKGLPMAPPGKMLDVEEVKLVTDVTTLPPVIKPTFIAEPKPVTITPKPTVSMEMPEVIVKERVDTFQVPTLTTAQRMDISTKVKQKFKQEIKPFQIYKERTVFKEGVVKEFKPAVALTYRPRVDVLAKARPITVTVTPAPGKPRVKPKPIPPIFVPKIKGRPVTKTPTKPMPGQEGHGYEIRRKGKWYRVNKPFAFATEEGAEASAMTQVQREAAASYRLVKSKKPVRKSYRKPTALQKVLFRPGKEKGVMVQKKLLRITTPGEVRQISLVGAAARRKQVKIKKVKKVKKKVVKKKVKRKIKKRKKK